MIRLELTFSTLSLISSVAFIFPLVPAVLAFYLGFALYDSRLSFLKVSAALAAVFLLLSALSFFLSACVLIRNRSALFAMHGVPLVGSIVAGCLWFSARISQGSRNAIPYNQIEIAFMILWVLAMLVSSMATTYFIIQFSYIENLPVLREAGVKEELTQNGHITPQRHLRDSQATFPCDLSHLSATIYDSPYRSHKQADSASTLPNSSPHNKRFLDIIGSPQLSSLKPTFKAHHQSDSTLYSYPTEFSQSALVQVPPLLPPATYYSDPTSPKRKLVEDGESAILPKKRNSSSVLRLVTSGMRSLSNGTRNLSNSFLPKNAVLKRATPEQPKVTITPAPYLGFDEWEVNAASLKDRLLISSMSNLETRNMPRTPSRRTVKSESPSKSYVESMASLEPIDWSNLHPSVNKHLSPSGFTKRSVTPRPSIKQKFSAEFTNSDEEDSNVGSDYPISDYENNDDTKDDDDQDRLWIQRALTTIHSSPNAKPLLSKINTQVSLTESVEDLSITPTPVSVLSPFYS